MKQTKEIKRQNKKRIGILTFHRAINYGALLQTYGLQEAFRSVGANVEIIDYYCPFLEKAYRLFWGLRKKSLTSWKNTLKGLKFVKAKKKAFRDFGSTFLLLSRKYNRKNIESSDLYFNQFVTGSDQVWNMKLSGFDTTYLLDFVKDNIKKNGYAISLGAYKLSEKEISLAASYDKISMREKSACEYVENCVGKNTHEDIDPTLLCDENTWYRLVLKERVIKEPYIFLYTVEMPREMIEAAKKVAAEKGLKVVYLHNRVKTDMHYDGVNMLTHCSPQEFLTIIKDAEYVMTNSFHGTVFSIIFKKKFLSELQNKNGFNNRVWDLLKALGLRERILDNVPFINGNTTINSEIDYEIIFQKLYKLRENSIDYLKQIISKEV